MMRKCLKCGRPFVHDEANQNMCIKHWAEVRNARKSSGLNIPDGVTGNNPKSERTEHLDAYVKKMLKDLVKREADELGLPLARMVALIIADRYGRADLA